MERDDRSVTIRAPGQEVDMERSRGDERIEVQVVACRCLSCVHIFVDLVHVVKIRAPACNSLSFHDL